MEAIAALAHAAELHPHAVCLQKGMGVTHGIQHADLVIPGGNVAFWAAGQMALGWATAAEQHRLALLRRGHGFLAHDAFDHLLDQAIGPQKNFFGAAVEAQRLLEVNVASIQAGAAAQGCEHGAGVAALDQVLQRAAATAVGQVGHVEDHGGPWPPDRFRDQMAPVRYKDPMRIDRCDCLRGELGWSGDALYGPSETQAEAIGQGAAPGSAGEQQQGALIGRCGVAHQLRVMPRARVMKSSCSSRGAA